jgi:anti-sigma regulatory factor (Ser/Thr protein kinase)
MDLTGSDPTVLARVRRWVATELADLGPDHLADVVLVTVELVTNAYEHGSGAKTVRLIRSRTPCSIRIEADDFNVDQLTLGRSRFGEQDHRGRGLIMVDKVGDQWGVRRHTATGTKTVWVDVSCAGHPC